MSRLTTAIIVGFRTPDDVVRCLMALAVQTRPISQIVVCENGGDCHAEAQRAAIAKLGRCPFSIAVVSAPDNPGYAGGINRALEAAPPSELVWVINPDAAPRPDAHAAMVRALDQGYDAMGGIVCDADGGIMTCGGNWNPATGYVRSLGDRRTITSPPTRDEIEPRLSFISGANMLMTRRFIDIAGPMRGDYFLYAEEVEWCLRATRKGLRLGYCPDAVIEHDQGASTGSALSHRERPRLPIYLDTRNRVLVVRDTGPHWLIVAVPAILLSVTLRYLARGAISQWRYAVAGWRAGVANERGKPGWMS